MLVLAAASVRGALVLYDPRPVRGYMVIVLKGEWEATPESVYVTDGKAVVLPAPRPSPRTRLPSPRSSRVPVRDQRQQSTRFIANALRRPETVYFNTSVLASAPVPQTWTALRHACRPLATLLRPCQPIRIWVQITLLKQNITRAARRPARVGSSRCGEATSLQVLVGREHPAQCAPSRMDDFHGTITVSAGRPSPCTRWSPGCRRQFFGASRRRCRCAENLNADHDPLSSARWLQVPARRRSTGVVHRLGVATTSAEQSPGSSPSTSPSRAASSSVAPNWPEGRARYPDEEARHRELRAVGQFSTRARKAGKNGTSCPASSPGTELHSASRFAVEACSA